MLHVVIMAGGGGTRFWPRSRQKRPKQFLTLAGQRTLLQQAIDRVESLAAPAQTWIITSAQHVEETARQAPSLPRDQIVGEPCGRDTAACIGLGAALVALRDPQAVMLVMPADHVIEPERQFGTAVHVAAQLAQEHANSLVTLGIPPTYPATGYGYIHTGELVSERQNVRVFKVRGFREKPDAELAEQMLATGEYFWNSGIFVWRAATILDELNRNQPTIAQAVRRIAEAWPTRERDSVFRREYEQLERISIDYAVMEKAAHVLTVQAPFRWDDVGAWLALERMNPQDAAGNTVLANHCGIQTKNCVIVGDSGQLITTVGVDNLLIVQDGDAILIADRRDEGSVKKLVEELKKRGLEKYL